MADMTATIAPKSDQLNADDLIVGPKTIKITKVSLLAEEQPVGINYEGDNSKPYKPCKSMRRVLVRVWGSDSNAYVGRSMTLYRDDAVTFGKDQVGGIRISHMSDIAREITMALTVTRARRKPYKVRPLAAANPELLKAGDEAAAKGVESYREWVTTIPAGEKEALRSSHQRWLAIAKKFDDDIRDDSLGITDEDVAGRPDGESASPEPGSFQGPHFSMTAGEMNVIAKFAGWKGQDPKDFVENWDDTKKALLAVAQKFNNGVKITENGINKEIY